MRELQFKTTGEWEYMGNSESQGKLTLTGNLDGWRKYFVFNQKDFSPEIWKILQKFTEAEEQRKNWHFLVNVKSNFLKSLIQTYSVEEILELKNEKGKFVYQSPEKPQLTPEKKESKVEAEEAVK